MYEIPTDDPVFGTPQGQRAATMKKAFAALAKMNTALAELKDAFAKHREKADEAAFAEYIAAFESLGRPAKMDKAEFVATRRADEASADLRKAAEADDSAYRLPTKRITGFGKIRS